MIAAAQAQKARVLLVGMRMPPNYGRAYTERFFGMFRPLATADKSPLVPFMLEGVADKPALFQADRLHPTAAGASDHPEQYLADVCNRWSKATMKYPALLQASTTCCPRLDEFDAIIDVRSAAEFAQDHIPGAINCPVLDDDERIRVGTLYKQISAFDAKKVGAALVARNIARHIEDAVRTTSRATGGRWSTAGAAATAAARWRMILARIGWPVMQLDGGYKDYRRAGQRGAGRHRRRCRFPRRLRHHRQRQEPPAARRSTRIGAQVLDLEQLAAHRGSVLGHLPSEPQPSQKMFETLVLARLRSFDPARPVFVESESKKVGNLRVPDARDGRACAPRPASTLQLSRAEPRAPADGRLPALLRRSVGARRSAGAPDAGCTAAPRSPTGRRWRKAARCRRWSTNCWSQHYDPAYLRSIDRNFVQYPQAQVVELADIGTDDFLAAARRLHDAPA